jgi:hypothetical protein
MQDIGLNTSNKYIKCCHDVKISLDPLSETPTLLRELLTGYTRQASNYRATHIYMRVQLSNGVRINGRRD